MLHQIKTDRFNGFYILTNTLKVCCMGKNLELFGRSKGEGRGRGGRRYPLPPNTTPIKKEYTILEKK